MKCELTLSIALLVRAPLNPLFPLLSLRIDALLGDAVLDTAEAGPSIVAFLTGFLAICTCVLYLSAFRSERRLSWNESRGEGIHMHRHSGVANGMHSRRRPNGIVRRRVLRIIAVGVLVVCRSHDSTYVRPTVKRIASPG
jgi:hypothetical protein